MEEKTIHGIPGGLYWFEKGRIGAQSGSKEYRFRREASNLGIISASNAFFYMTGAAQATALIYFSEREKHFKTIDSFFFTPKKRNAEAESLNELGIAEEILFHPEEYFIQNSGNKSVNYAKELAEILDEMEKGTNPYYQDLKSEISDAKENISIIGREFLNAHLGFDIYSENKPAPGDVFLFNKNMRSGILDLSKTANESFAGQKKFSFAAQFLQNHVFSPSRRYFENLDMESEILRYAINKINKGRIFL